jgi:hypothetical protein
MEDNPDFVSMLQHIIRRDEAAQVSVALSTHHAACPH